MWLKPTAIPSTFAFVGSQTSNNGIQIQNSSSTAVLTYCGTSPSSAGKLTLNSWQHVAVTFSGGTVILYLNGSSFQTLTGQSSFTFNLMASPLNGGFYQGYIDDYRIYSSTLTSNRIAALAQGQSMPGGMSGTGPIVYTGTGTVTNHPTVSSAGTRSIPVYLGAGTLSNHPTVSAAGTNAVPVYHGSSTKTVSHATISSTATCPTPVYHGASTLSTSNTISSLGGNIIPNYTGTATLSRHPTLSATVVYSGPANSQCTLYIRGTTNPEALNNIPLYTYGLGVASQTVTAITQGFDESDSVTPLVVEGVIAVTGTTPLYTAGTPALINDSMTLFVKTWIPVHEAMNMVVAVAPIPLASKAQQLFVQGRHAGTLGGMSMLMPLMLMGSDLPPHESMNLVVVGQDRGGTSEVMNLWIAGAYRGISNWSTLYLENHTAGIAGYSPLFVRGDGLTPGALPFGHGMSLFIERGPNAGMTLYLENKNSGQYLPLQITGHPAINSMAPLFVDGLGGTVTGTALLVMPKVSTITAITFSTNLVIPSTTALKTANSQLYVSGWTP